MGRKSILQFIHSLRLNKSDEAVLIRHIEDSHVEASGPDIHDRCTDKVRRFLELRPPPEDLSWKARIKLEDALNAGFTSKEAYQMGIPAIGVVAVLVASVAFTGWAAPPGGSSATWAGCPYPMFTAFLIVNGFAFMLSLASVIVVTAFPLVLNRTPHQAAWWGGILLIVSMLAFIVAFLLAGFVTVNFKAPPPTCSILKCTQGGIRCDMQSYGYVIELTSGNITGYVHYMDANLVALNQLGNSSARIMCTTYDRVEWLGNTTMTATIHPGNFSDPQQIYADPLLQNKTVCMDQLLLDQAVRAADIPDSFGIKTPLQIDGSSLAFNISYGEVQNHADLDSLAQKENIAHWIGDLFKSFGSYSGGLQVYAYNELNYFCMGKDATTLYSTLCDRTSVDLVGNLSVGKTGNYLRVSTAADNSALVFDTDVTARQVSMAVKSLAGVFAFILIIIVVFLVKSKWL